MPPGQWIKGKTAKTDKKIAIVGKKISARLNEPGLKLRLTEKKRLSLVELTQQLKDSQTQWTFVGSFDGYTRRTDRNMVFRCPMGHEQTMSWTDACGRFRCKTCNPKRGMGNRNPAYVPLEEFYERLGAKHGFDRFGFVPTTYKGLIHKIEFVCNECQHTFKKKPGVLLSEKYSCMQCSRAGRSLLQMRTAEEFFKEAHASWGDKYTFHPRIGQTYRNTDTISRTCNVCNTIDDQSVPSLLANGGCRTCAKRTYVSKGETEWLDALKIPPENRNIYLRINGIRYNVDALINGTVYEYYGDYWHGNPNTYPSDKINAYAGKTMQQLHDATLERKRKLQEAGYVVITMWEQDWMSLRKTRPKRQRP